MLTCGEGYPMRAVRQQGKAKTEMISRLSPEGRTKVTRPLDMTDTGSAVLELCGAETLVYAHRNGSREHEAICADCAILRAWWAHRLPPRRGQLELGL